MTMASGSGAGRGVPRFVAMALALLLAGGSALGGQTIPVPLVTIYPGDVIRDTMLTERDLPPDFAGRAITVVDRSGLVGKTARHTLLPGLPISTNAVGEPKIVTTGAMVRVVFIEGGLMISTYASALQSGSVGDVIPVRNLESGLTISGTIESDGSVRVSNG